MLVFYCWQLTPPPGWILVAARHCGGLVPYVWGELRCFALGPCCLSLCSCVVMLSVKEKLYVPATCVTRFATPLHAHCP